MWHGAAFGAGSNGADEVAVVVGIEERSCGEAFAALGCFDDATVEVFAGDRRVVPVLRGHSFWSFAVS